MQYDANVKVNITIEYDSKEEQAPGDVKEDLRSLFESFDRTMSGARVWVVEVLSTGQPSRID